MQKGHSIMEIMGIKNIYPAASKALSKKGWKLTDSLREKIMALAREDAVQGAYMGNQFLALRKSEVVWAVLSVTGTSLFLADKGFCLEDEEIKGKVFNSCAVNLDRWSDDVMRMAVLGDKRAENTWLQPDVA